MRHIKLFKEHKLWNKDSDIGDKILKNLDKLKPSDIEKDDEFTYLFELNDFGIICKWSMEEFTNPFTYIAGEYIIEADGVKLDIGWNKSRKIYNKVKSIKNQEKIKRDIDKKRDDNYIKKDLRSSFR